MPDHYDLVQELTRPNLEQGVRSGLLSEFASGLGWHPSDALVLPTTASFAPVHLLVEHGLRNTAVLSFVSGPGFPALNSVQKQTLLGLSYNNLVDWHLAIDPQGVSYVYNRGAPPTFFEHRESISRDRTGPLSSNEFERIAQQRRQPNLPALDDALIRTISNWKLQLAALIPDIPTTAISAFFNVLIFIRAVEDQVGRQQEAASDARVLLSALRASNAGANGNVDVNAIIRSALQQLGLSATAVPSTMEPLSAFGELPALSLAQLFGDLYQNRFASYYRYDFSVMSRHALSRIYEHYVSLLRPVDTDQLALLPALPEEEFARALGHVYTPEFIARFFAKFARDHFRGARRPLRVLDPACGSGIFLRTFLESETAQAFGGTELAGGLRTPADVAPLFHGVTGVDIDLNACNATRLSLSLLHLALTGNPATCGHILHKDALATGPSPEISPGSIDLVIANPPYVSFERQDGETRLRVAEQLGSAAFKRPDTYLAFLALALRALRPGGLGLFVLPQTFLINESAALLRRELADRAWIKCVADLSTVPVFEQTGVYPILLAFEKKIAGSLAPRAILARCRDSVGDALGRILSGVATKTADFDVFEVEQENFQRKTWIVLPPAEDRLVRAFSTLPRLHEFLDIHQGMITGADDVFIVPKRAIPKDGRELFRPFLSDRDIDPFAVPSEKKLFVFVPFLADGTPIDAKTLSKRHPETWAYLKGNQRTLRARKPVEKKQVPWWRPTRPRDPASLFQPKIVTPHLVILPQFALDIDGTFAVSRCPYMIARKDSPESEVRTLLKYFVAVLNSSTAFWHINQHARRYGGRGGAESGGRRGYALLEVSELRDTPVPNPAGIPPQEMRALVELVDRRLEDVGPEAVELERQIDEKVADLYGLSAGERKSIGLSR